MRRNPALHELNFKRELKEWWSFGSHCAVHASGTLVWVNSRLFLCCLFSSRMLSGWFQFALTASTFPSWRRFLTTKLSRLFAQFVWYTEDGRLVHGGFTRVEPFILSIVRSTIPFETFSPSIDHSVHSFYWKAGLKLRSSQKHVCIGCLYRTRSRPSLLGVWYATRWITPLFQQSFLGGTPPPHWCFTHIHNRAFWVQNSEHPWLNPKCQQLGVPVTCIYV